MHRKGKLCVAGQHEHGLVLLRTPARAGPATPSRGQPAAPRRRISSCDTPRRSCPDPARRSTRSKALASELVNQDKADEHEAPRAVVLLSGGLDSSTVLAWAQAEGRRCHALSFDYGQRHRIERERAAEVAEASGAVEHRVVSVDLASFGGSALTDDIDVPRHMRPLKKLLPDVLRTLLRAITPCR